MKSLTSHIIPHQEIDAQKWDQFILDSPQGGLYALYDYASVIRNDWQAIIVEEKGEWVAVMPFCLNKRWKYISLPQPLLTQYWGIFLKSFSIDTSTRKILSQKEAIISKIIPHLAKAHLFIQNFSTQFDYPLPFHWAGYELKTKYTYHLKLDKSADDLFMSFSPHLRRQIRKAEKNGLTFDYLSGTKELLGLFSLNQDIGHNIVNKTPENYQKIEAIGQYLIKSGNGIIRGVKDKKDQIIAVSVFAFFKDKMIYLMGASHPDHGNSGAGALLMWSGIQEAKKRELAIFDFEGSMIQGVEHFFRKFGAVPVSYLQIYKNRLPLLIRWIQKLR